MVANTSSTYSGKSRKRQIQWRKIFIIVLVWPFIGLVIAIYDHLSLLSAISQGFAEGYTFIKHLIFNLSAALMGSFFGGMWLVLYVNEKARDKPYGFTLLAVALSFFVIVSFIMLTLGTFLVKHETGEWPFGNEYSTKAFYDHLSNPLHVKNIIVWGTVVLLTQFILQMNDKFGQGLLWSFITGKYHRPQHEKRIFMFLDLIGSTTIAEKLGNEQYYNMLRDFFADVTNSIIYNNGIIYQYAGDEVIVSWPVGKDNTDCINCYFDIRRRVDALSIKYQERYGLVPDFKAALHFGEVTAGEIGIIKRELTYSGDVLNTTARIMSQCKVYDRKLLVSGQLHGHLTKSSSSYTFEKMGKQELRGKSEQVEIYAVDQ